MCKVPLRKCEKESVRVRRVSNNCMRINGRSRKGSMREIVETSPAVDGSSSTPVHLWKNLRGSGDVKLVETFNLAS